MKDYLKTPDWDKWKKRIVVSIYEAVYLSLDIEPPKDCNDVYIVSGWLKSKITNNLEYEERLKISGIALLLESTEDGHLKSMGAVLNDVHPKVAQVKLTCFGEWAESQEWELPKGFPKKKGRMRELHDGVKELNLPYECPFIVDLLKTMWIYEEARINGTLGDFKQDTMAKDLGILIKIPPPKNGDPDPFCKRIIARISPPELRAEHLK